MVLGVKGTYDGFDRTTGIKIGGVTTSFDYNTDSDRVSKTTNGKTTESILDNGSVSADLIGETLKVFTEDNSVFCQNGVFSYNVINTKGDIIASDGSNGIDYNYNAYGTELYKYSSANPIGYRNYYYDSETGLYYLKARYYDPTTGQFTQEDTVQDDNLQYNLYGYCSGNPVLYTDADGHKKKKKKSAQKKNIKTFNYNRNNAYYYMQKYYNVKEKSVKIGDYKILLSVSGNNKDYEYFKSGDCANFVSQCLHAGGLPMLKEWYSTYTWVGTMSGNSYRRYSYTKTWSLVLDQKRFLKKYFSNKEYDVNSMSKLKRNIGNISVGDVIYFQGKDKSNYNHAAIVSYIDRRTNSINYAQHSKPRLYGSLANRFNDYKKIVIYHIKDSISIDNSLLK